MDEHSVLLDAFAEARRTWDDVVSLQPDIVARAGLKDADLAELARRVSAHQMAADILANALETAERVESAVKP